MDRIRYMVLGTIDEDGCTRTSPVYFVPHRYRDWRASQISDTGPYKKVRIRMEDGKCRKGV